MAILFHAKPVRAHTCQIDERTPPQPRKTQPVKPAKLQYQMGHTRLEPTRSACAAPILD